MNKATCCLECSFMDWDQKYEHFFCARTLECLLIRPSTPSCQHALRKIYRKRQPRPLTYQLNFTGGQL